MTIDASRIDISVRAVRRPSRPPSRARRIHSSSAAFSVAAIAVPSASPR